MLVFCNNFLNSPQFLYDSQLNRCYLLIRKNGSSSLRKLAANTDPIRYSIQNLEFLKQKNITNIVVFLRHPIDRYKSGLKTYIQLGGISPEATAALWDAGMLMFHDRHTTPQFWELLAIHRKLNVIFEFYSLDEINRIIPNIGHFNKRNDVIAENNEDNIPDNILNQLNHFYTEDLVLYNKFLGIKTTIDKVINEIKLEKDFVNDYSQYQNILNYLF